MATPAATARARRVSAPSLPGAKVTGARSTAAPPSSTFVAKGSGTAPRTTSSVVMTKAPPPTRRTALNKASAPPSRTDSPATVPEESNAAVAVNGDGADEEAQIQRQTLDSTISTLNTENDSLRASLAQAEIRLKEFYADQTRMEDEMSTRLELTEKLRTQLREVEKEKRDVTRRYNEQTKAIDSERQSFYDNEQHLKSRIQSLTQARKEQTDSRKQLRPPQPDDDAKSIVSEVEYPVPPRTPGPDELKTPRVSRRRGATLGAEDRLDGPETEDASEPAEMTSLKLELATLATSHASIQSTLQLLQAQLLDLQRVNAELQEENEGWNVLVQQRTLAGTFNINGLTGSTTPPVAVQDDDATSIHSYRSSKGPTLDRVSELEELEYENSQEGGELDPDLVDPEDNQRKGTELDPAVFGGVAEGVEPAKDKRRGSVTAKGTSKGESLADLPITGPGLDLAAELGRAENTGGFVLGQPPKNARKKSNATVYEDKPGPNANGKTEVETLRSEVKNLKDANKALSLYASKIIDRIISMEGFENVLAVDFQAPPPTPAPGGFSKLLSAVTGKPPPTPSLPPVEKLTTFESIRMQNSVSFPATSSGPPPVPPKNELPKADRRSRRSISFDFRGLFGGNNPGDADKRPNDLKPLTIRPGSMSFSQSQPFPGPGTPTSARKLETTAEDEDDRKERERLRATMRLMGIEQTTNAEEAESAPDGSRLQPKRGPPPPINLEEPPRSPLPQLNLGGKVIAVGEAPPTPLMPPPTPGGTRWSFFGRRSRTTSMAEVPSAPLTHEALKQVEAEQHIAAIDAREKVVKEEISRGSGSGFTELTGLRGSPSGSGAGVRKSLGEEWRSRRSSISVSSLGGGGMVSGSEGHSRSGMKSPPRRDASDAGSASIVFNVEDDD